MAATKRERELAAENEQLRDRNAELEARVKALEALLAAKAEAKSAKKPKFTDNYSLAANKDKLTGKPKRKRRKKSTGRRPHAAKDDQVEDEVDVFPDGVNRKRCVFHKTQRAWRFIDGRAVYVQYNLYAPPGQKRLPTPPGLRNRRSEFGLEIIIALTYLHYWIGISIDNARQVIDFFTGLPLSRSQADSLLTQLANDWSEDYDAIAELIALQMIVYIDETGWKVGTQSRYTWAFSSTMYVFFRCGVGRGKAEAQAVLGEQFEGVGVTDDYAVYKALFSEHQLCWAHLLRKAIKLALQNPEGEIYAEFLNDLYEIYRQAVAYRKDERLSVGRTEKVSELKRQIEQLCNLEQPSGMAGAVIEEEMPTDTADFIRLQNELLDNLDCLFVFVQKPEVEPTNNLSERTVRREAEIRKGGRTSKTEAGAKRRSIATTVLASLRTRMLRFTLKKVVDEIMGWVAAGQSIFQTERAAARAGPSD